MANDGVHALVQRAKDGDERAWQDLHTLLQPYLLRLARDALGPAWPDIQAAARERHSRQGHSA